MAEPFEFERVNDGRHNVIIYVSQIRQCGLGYRPQEVAAFLGDAGTKEAVKRLSDGQRRTGPAGHTCDSFKQPEHGSFFGVQKCSDVVGAADGERRRGFLTGVNVRRWEAAHRKSDVFNSVVPELCRDTVGVPSSFVV